MSAVFDANVWISGIQFGGKPAELIQMARDGETEVFISQAILDETLRILRDKFHRTDLEEVRGFIERYTTTKEPSVTLDVVKNDPADNKILECAVAAEANTVVTGDKHLLALKTYRGMRILRPAEFLRDLRER